MSKTYAYQHRPLSSILAPENGTKDDESQTKNRDEKGRFKADESTQDDLPEKYRGKTAAEIAEMHRNAESRLGQLQNEVGSLRGLVSDLSQVQRPAQPKNEEQEKIDVSGDDLLADPVSAIRKVVQQDLTELRSERDTDLAEKRIQNETDALLRDFGDIETITASKEFQEFAMRTPSRTADLETAAQGEGLDQVKAARRLLEDFTDFEHTIKPESQSHEKKEDQKPSGVERAKAAATEGAGPSGKISSENVIHESDVIKLIQSDPAKYRSPSFQAELMSAIKDGRFVKQ